jgi:uncharacterized protein (DUF2164 family)
MTDIKRKWDRASAEERTRAEQELIDLFAVERDEKIGLVAAEGILDFFLPWIGPALCSKGVMDAKKVLSARTEDMQYALDELVDA